ncbi:hypothetical protein [Streptomyces sp. MJP52]|uniref:hypothetical protein n=1 Tax=Streptomyces sp. MJP52 TaxID=2940555 RepID=UPI0024758F8B|nr:hypothetical protein [Streptomyces sp. MJP52]MDH6226201.1 hypothetical protein [Streptomyces sp. MJP52]
MSGWRYHALRILDRTWIHRDLPLRDVAISPALSGPGAMSATLDPDTWSLKTAGGEPLLVEWRDLIIAEASDEIRFAGLLVGSEFTGQSWQLDIAGVSAWPQGQPQPRTLSYGGATVIPGGPISGMGADPVAIVRDLWAQLQDQPDAGLGVTIGGAASSSYRLAHWYGIPNRYTYHPDASTSVTLEPYAGSSVENTKTYEYVQVVVAGTGFDRKTKAKLDKIPDKVKLRPGPYWRHYEHDYERTDVGARINELARVTPFDYIERASWTDTAKSDVALRVDIGYPRIGTRKSALRFVEGENISDLVTVRQDGEDYANGVVAVGAGDGKDQLRETVVSRDGRVRRVKVLTASSITTKSQLREVARTELARANLLETIEGFTVREHPHAPYGSYQVGDDVRVQVTTGWAAGTSMWVRITGLTYRPDSDTVQVTCTRSSSFSYGSPTS